MENPSAVITRLTKALEAVAICCKRQEDYVAYHEGLELKFEELCPAELPLARCALALQFTRIHWQMLPWHTILPFLDARTLLCLRWLTFADGRWQSIVEYAIKTMPIAFDLHPRAQIPTQRVVGRCTGKYLFEHEAQLPRYLLQNGKIGQSKVHLFHFRHRWILGSLCTTCRVKTAKKICSQCMRSQIAISNSASKRFPPLNLEWKPSRLFGANALVTKSIVSTFSTVKELQSTYALNYVELSGAPKHVSTLNGVFEKHENINFNGLPIYEHCDNPKLTLRKTGGLHRQHRDQQERCSAVLYRSDSGFWSIKIGDVNTCNIINFIRSSLNGVYFRALRCGSLTPCSLDDARTASSWIWEENVQLRVRQPNDQNQEWFRVEKLRCFKEKCPNVATILVQGAKIQGSEFEGVYSLVTRFVCVNQYKSASEGEQIKLFVVCLLLLT